MSPLKPQPSFSKFDHPFLEAVADGDLNSLRQQADSDPGVILAARDAKGNTAAHVAAALGRLPEFEFLVDREPSLLLAANEVRSTPAHRAAEAGEVPVLRAVRARAPALLAARGALGATPLHLAAAHGRLRAVVFLAEEGGPGGGDAPLLALRDRRGATALHYAAAQGSLDVLAWAAARLPALIPAPNDQGDTAAHCAARAGAADALRALAQRCPAVLAVRNAHGLLPADVAVGPACRQLLADLPEAPPPPTPAAALPAASDSDPSAAAADADADTAGPDSVGLDGAARRSLPSVRHELPPGAASAAAAPGFSPGGEHPPVTASPPCV